GVDLGERGVGVGAERFVDEPGDGRGGGAAAGQPEGDAVAGADGRLESALAGARGRFVLVKPDRYVAAVFPSARAARVRDALAGYFDMAGHFDTVGHFDMEGTS
ncbi:hypothetical protein, partial [Actinomadura montaniterrae]